MLTKLLVFALFILVGMNVTSYMKGRQVQSAPPTLNLLRIEETMTTPAPPDPPADDTARLRERLSRLTEIWSSKLTESPETITGYAEIALKSGDMLSARGILGGLGSRSENTAAPPKAQEMLGQCLLELVKYASALQVYESLLRQNPAYTPATIGVSRAYRGMEKNAEAVKALSAAAASLSPGDAQGGLALAAELQKSLQNTQALTLLEMLYQKETQNSVLALTYAFALYNQQRFDDAEKIVGVWLKQTPEDSRVNLYYGILLANPLYKQRDPALAEHYLLKALQLKPGDVNIMGRLGSMMMEQERYHAAIYVYSNLLTAVPDSSGARLQLANAYSRSGDVENAQKQKEIARRLVERDSEEERLNITVSHSPTDYRSHFALARHYLQYGQLSGAYFQLQIALVHSRNSAEVKTELNKLFEKIGLPLPPTYQVTLL